VTCGGGSGGGNGSIVVLSAATITTRVVVALSAQEITCSNITTNADIYQHGKSQMLQTFAIAE
jgi:hypothetical protein